MSALWIAQWIEPGGPSPRMVTRMGEGNISRVTGKLDRNFVKSDIFICSLGRELGLAFKQNVSLLYRVQIPGGSGSGSRTDSSFLAVPGPVLELNQVIWRFRVRF